MISIEENKEKISEIYKFLGKNENIKKETLPKAIAKEYENYNILVNKYRKTKEEIYHTSAFKSIDRVMIAILKDEDFFNNIEFCLEKGCYQVISLIPLTVEEVSNCNDVYCDLHYDKDY